MVAKESKRAAATSLIAVALAAALLAGCQTVRAGGFCDVADPIRVSSATIAAMSDQEVADTLAHNKKGEELCGWKP